ncbi:MAG TPA: VWA domain-containing protein [Vicinamibacterales bacterium]|nr:VWA domain-containing protein [Vicinamibacterales bacterium]
MALHMDETPSRRRFLGWRRASTTLAVSVCGLAIPLQEQHPTFRDRTRIVPVYVTVRDSRGQFVPDLPREDFRVFDNGHERPIEVFENKIEPIAVVVLRDDSDSLRGARAIKDVAIRSFIDALLPGDLARLAEFADKVTFSPHWSGDHSELVAHLAALPKGGGNTALGDAVRAGLGELEGQQGRPVLLLLSDGGAPGVSALATLVPERVTVYFVGIWNGATTASRYLREAFQFASDSGGGYHLLRPTDDMAKVFREISDELHHRYLLGFSPAVLDGKKHSIEVRTTRSGMNVRSRSSYIAVDR